jgi:hypothetical protein
MKISQSGLKKFEQCGGKFALRYVDGLEEDSNHWAEVGRLVHKLIEIKLSGGVTDLAEPAAGAMVEAMDLYHRWLNRFYPDLDPNDVLEVEGQISLQMGKHELDVRFDDVREIGGFLTITDWKTTHKMLTVEELKADIQTRVYCVAAMKLWDHADEMIFRHGSIRHGVYQSLELERSEVESWEPPLQDLINSAGGHYEAKKRGDPGACPFTPGDPCSTCGYFTRCPAVTKVIAPVAKGTLHVKEIGNIKGAETVATRLLILEQYFKDQKKALKKYCEENGGVTINGSTWAIRASEQSWVDLDRIPEEVLEEMRPYMVLDDGKKSPLWENEALLRKLQAYGAIKVKVRTNFGHAKQGEDVEG